MATETVAAGSGAPDPNEKKNTKKEKQNQKEETTGPAGEKKLTGIEIKAKAKAEKAARRAQQKSTQGVAAPAQVKGPPAQGGGDAKGGKSKAKQDGPHPAGASGAKGPPPKPVVVIAKEVQPTIPECFSHLSWAKRVEMTQADKDVHPAVLVLGQQMSAFVISDSTTRLEGTLLAFKKVIDSYTTPQGNTFSRHFTSHILNPQIEFLTACRPMCFSMGNAIRWLKLQISKIDIDLPDSEAKKLLSESLDNFIQERITLADTVIVRSAADMIEDGEVVLTYAHHNLVERVLLQAKTDGKSFKVVVVDDPFERTGQELAKSLRSSGLDVAYSPGLYALKAHLQDASRVLVGAEAMFSNGAMYARSGTCDVVLAAADLGVRVVALSETINFTERVAMDSLTYNEIDPERNSASGLRLLFDTTKDKYISVVVTELGNTSPNSVPAILRKLEEL